MDSIVNLPRLDRDEMLRQRINAALYFAWEQAMKDVANPEPIWRLRMLDIEALQLGESDGEPMPQSWHNLLALAALSGSRPSARVAELRDSLIGPEEYHEVRKLALHMRAGYMPLEIRSGNRFRSWAAGLGDRFGQGVRGLTAKPAYAVAFATSLALISFYVGDSLGLRGASAPSSPNLVVYRSLESAANAVGRFTLPPMFASLNKLPYEELFPNTASRGPAVGGDAEAWNEATPRWEATGREVTFRWPKPLAEDCWLTVCRDDDAKSGRVGSDRPTAKELVKADFLSFKLKTQLDNGHAYRWWLTSVRDPSVASPEFGFVVLPTGVEDLLSALKRNDPRNPLALIQAYVDLGMVTEAKIALDITRRAGFPGEEYRKALDALESRLDGVRDAIRSRAENSKSPDSTKRE
jgi:hypothetical protein